MDIKNEYKSITPIEKSIALRLINKRKEKFDASCNKYLSLEDIEDIDNNKKILLEDVRLLKEMIDPGYQYEAWMLPELEKLEQELNEEEVLEENWNNLLENKNYDKYDEILEILEKKYRMACKEHDAKEMEDAVHLIRVTKRKHIDKEIGKNIIEGKCNENTILFNTQIL